MAELSTDDRAIVWRELMERISVARLSISITKAELLAAVNAIDTFLDANAATINNALPLPARTSLTTPQKALLLMYVVARRYLVGG